ncbi:MAG: flagellar biosynthesis repressor FlbT [Paracoccaceae bacterium]
MPGLILKLRAHEQILVNGVVMQNGERPARLVVKPPDAKILRLRDAIHPDTVDTPVKRVCYVAQLAVAGEADPETARRELSRGIAQLRDALDGLDGAGCLDTARERLEAGNFYACLRELRRLLPIEARLLGLDEASGNGAPAAREEPARRAVTVAHGRAVTAEHAPRAATAGLER